MKDGTEVDEECWASTVGTGSGTAESWPAEADSRGGTIGESPLVEALGHWRPGVVELTRRVDPWVVEAFAKLIDADCPLTGSGSSLPPLWHWLVLADHPASSELGDDGHPARGPLLPPIPHRRRMFAGGWLHQVSPIPIGSDLSCRSQIADVTVKSGRSGEVALVRVCHDLTIAGRSVATEHQDIVYRSQPPGVPRSSSPGPSVGQPPPRGPWRQTLKVDSVLLARFSALTYNGHRIHYDERYTTQIERYPGLVVHGPLLALLALELPRVNAARRSVTVFDYRLVEPVFAPCVIWARGRQREDRIEVTVSGEGAGPSLIGSGRLSPPGAL